MDGFDSTQWSLVLAAGAGGSTAGEALAELCNKYWRPIFTYVRPRANSTEDALDLVQGFFADVLARQTIAGADPGRGKFRAYLLTSLKYYIANEHARAHAQKRGGGIHPISIDSSELALADLPVDKQLTADQRFERDWAISLLNRVMESLQLEQCEAGRETEFQRLRPFLAGEQVDHTLVEIAVELGTTAEALRAAVYRLRKRFRVLLRSEVAHTVRSVEEIDDELKLLVAAVSS